MELGDCARMWFPTLYLSTMGSLIGPFMGLVKLGKLSRWAMNGKPLVREMVREERVWESEKERINSNNPL